MQRPERSWRTDAAPPEQNLITHVGDPWHINVATNGYAHPLPRTRPRLVRLTDA